MARRSGSGVFNLPVQGAGLKKDGEGGRGVVGAHLC